MKCVEMDIYSREQGTGNREQGRGRGRGRGRGNGGKNLLA